MAMELNLHASPELKTQRIIELNRESNLERSCTYNLHFKDGDTAESELG